jgi:hypothetical protein
MGGDARDQAHGRIIATRPPAVAAGHPG